MKKRILTLFTVLAVLACAAVGMTGCGGGDIVPTGVSLNYKSRSLAAGTSVQLKATVEPEDAKDKSLVWSSEDESVATVDESGKVTAVAIGETVVKATTVVGGFSAECKITVAPKEIESIEITTRPNKTTYIEGEIFNNDGVVVTGVYSDGSEENVTDYCTFKPETALTTDIDEIVVTYRGTEIQTKLSVTVNKAVSTTVKNDTELAAALKDMSINCIDVDKNAQLSSLSVNRNIIVRGTLDIASMSVTDGASINVVGDVASSGNLIISGDGLVVVSGNIRGQSIEINGTLNLVIKGIIDDAIYDGEDVEAIIYATSAIYSHHDIVIQRATVDAYNNIFSKGTTTINQGATVSVYGISWCRNEAAYAHDDFGNGLQARGGLTISDAETTVKVMNNTDIENGKAALQSDGQITISGAIVELGKAENVTCYYSWGIWATNGYLTVTDGAQIKMILKNEADLDPDADVNSKTTGIGSNRTPPGTLTFEQGTGDIPTKVEIFAGRAIRDRVNVVGQEFIIFTPWVE